MGELQDMADHVVVIGRGKVLADASVEELIARASGDQVLVRTSAATEAAAALQRPATRDGHRRQHHQRVGGRAQRIVEVLDHAQIPFSEVTALRATLEDVYLQLTGGEAEFRGGSDRKAQVMIAATSPPSRPPNEPQSEGFGPVFRSEWTKLRTVRGWVIGLAVAAVLCVAFTFVVGHGNHEGSCTSPPPPGSGPHSPGTNCYTGHPFVPTGPNGEAVADSYQFVEQPLTGNGTLTAESPRSPASSGPVRPTLHPRWPTRAGAGGVGKGRYPAHAEHQQGSPYAAVMATGSHGIRFQYNYTHDQPGLPGGDHEPAPRAGCA